jgi:hypothetical protein
MVFSATIQPAGLIMIRADGHFLAETDGIQLIRR